MADLSSYLHAKLKKAGNPSPTKVQELQASSERLSKSMEFETKEEADYSPTSEFWRHTNLQVFEEAKSPTRKNRDLMGYQMADKEIDSKSTVSALLKKFKNHGPTEIANNFKVVEAPIQDLSHDKRLESLMKFLDQLDQAKACTLFDFKEFEQKMMAKVENSVRNANDVSSKLESQMHSEQLSKLEALKTSINQLREIPPVTTASGDGHLETSIKNLMVEIRGDNDSRMETFMKQVKTELNGATTNTNSSMVDRPTRNLISGMNDKLIQLSKLSQHEFTTTEQRLTKLEKKLGNLDSIASLLDRFYLEFKHNRPRAQSTKSVSDCSSKISGDELVMDQYGHIYSELLHLNTKVENDQKLNEERMGQFMSMFSILQEAHATLIGQKGEPSLDSQVQELKNSVDDIKKQNQEILKLLKQK